MESILEQAKNDEKQVKITMEKAYSRNKQEWRKYKERPNMFNISKLNNNRFSSKINFWFVHTLDWKWVHTYSMRPLIFQRPSNRSLSRYHWYEYDYIPIISRTIKQMKSIIDYWLSRIWISLLLIWVCDKILSHRNYLIGVGSWKGTRVRTYSYTDTYWSHEHNRY